MFNLKIYSRITKYMNINFLNLMFSHCFYTIHFYFSKSNISYIHTKTLELTHEIHIGLIAVDIIDVCIGKEKNKISENESFIQEIQLHLANKLIMSLFTKDPITKCNPVSH